MARRLRLPVPRNPSRRAADRRGIAAAARKQSQRQQQRAGADQQPRHSGARPAEPADPARHLAMPAGRRGRSGANGGQMARRHVNARARQHLDHL